jgi:hypothetical protein
MYMKGKICKEPLKEYNNRKANTIIEKLIYIYPSNSWWINNTEFREVKLMMGASLSLCEEIC